MKKILGMALLGMAFNMAWAQSSGGGTAAPVAGQATLGVAVEQMDAVVTGWSAKKSILGKAVYNDQNQKVGTIEDIIIAPSNSVSYAIVKAGGFIGIGKHDVAIPVNQFKFADNKFVLPGATKEALKALPKFEYSRKK